MNFYTKEQVSRDVHDAKAVTAHASKIFNGRAVVRVEGSYRPLDGDDIALIFVLDDGTRVLLTAYSSCGVARIDIDTRETP